MKKNSKIERLELNEKKNNTKLMIIISVAVLVLVGVGVLCALSVKDQKKTSESEKEKEINQIPDVEGLTNSDKEDILDLVGNLEYFDFRGLGVNSVSDLTNQEVLQFARDYILNNTDKKLGDDITLTEVKDVVSKYLGRDFSPENIRCKELENVVELTDLQKSDYIYDESNEKFVYNRNHPGHGNNIGKVLNKIDGIDIQDNSYIVTVYKAFENIRTEGNVSGYYPTYNDATMGLNAIYEGGEKSKDELFANKDKLTKHIYTFIKNGDNFILLSYKIGDSE